MLEKTGTDKSWRYVLKVIENLEYELDIFLQTWNGHLVIWNQSLPQNIINLVNLRSFVWNQETKKLWNQGTKKPRNQETKRTTNTKNRVTKKPTNQETFPPTPQHTHSHPCTSPPLGGGGTQGNLGPNLRRTQTLSVFYSNWILNVYIEFGFHLNVDAEVTSIGYTNFVSTMYIYPKCLFKCWCSPL